MEVPREATCKFEAKMQRLQTCEEKAEFLIEIAHNRPEKLLTSVSSSSKWKSLHQKLLDLYLEESRKEAHNKQLKCSSSLLEKLVKRDKLNTLVVNLYPGNDGYSLMLKTNGGADSETIKLPYEESEFLQDIDNEELPAILVDLLDRVQANLFYSGCVICELRDYRRSVNSSYETQYVLLKPSTQSLQCDMNTLTNDGHLWTQEDQFTLESQLLLATAEPLCLDPSPTTFYVANKLVNEKYQLNTRLIKRSVKKYTQSAVNRKRKMAQCSAPPNLKLHDFVTKKRDKVKGAPAVNLRVGKTCVDMWRQRDVPLTTPSAIDVLKYAKQIDKTKLTMDNTPIIIEEFTFESERGQGKINFSRLTILKRVSDEFYLGELYVDRDFQEGSVKGSTCKFPLGTKSNVEKYIKQFREIFTEEGRRQVKITHQIQGAAPSISFTQAATTATTGNSSVAGTTSSTQAMLTQAANLAATLTGQINLPGPGGDTNKRPIQLSLSIKPPGTTTASRSQPTTPAAGQQSTTQLTLSLQQQQQLAAAQKIRQMGIVNLSRSSSAPNTPNQSVSFQPSLSTISSTTTSNLNLSAASNRGPTIQFTAAPQSFAKPLGQSGTPPPNVTITMAGNIPIARRPSGTESLAKSRGGPYSSAPHSAPATPTAADPSGTANQILAAISTSGTIMSVVPPNLSAANIAGPQNINIQNLTGLQGVNIANLSSLQNIQVTVSGMPGGIAVPLCLNMLSSNSQPNVVFSGAGGQTSTATVPSIQNLQCVNLSSDGTGDVSRLAISQTTNPIAPRQQHHQLQQHIQSSPSGSVISGGQSAGMLSLPIGVAGNITQFMAAAGLKGTQGIRPGTPLLLSQVPGQQPLQLLSTGFPQGTRLQLNNPQHTPNKLTPQSPQTINPGLLSPQHIPPQPQLGGFSPLRPTPQSSIGGQQFLQLAPQQSMTHLTIQGGAAVLTPPRSHKKKFPGATPPRS